jgi:hypothetical protein
VKFSESLSVPPSVIILRGAAADFWGRRYNFFRTPPNQKKKKEPPAGDPCGYGAPRYWARVTLPERMQLVQTLIRRTVPPSFTLTDWMLTFHFLRVWRFEWETLLPDAWPFPHIAHFLDISNLRFYPASPRGGISAVRRHIIG